MFHANPSRFPPRVERHWSAPFAIDIDMANILIVEGDGGNAVNDS